MKLMIATEAKLAEVPTALRFHGITESQIEATGLTVKEFIYLVGSFSAGQTFYEFEQLNPEVPFPQDNYRGVMCSHEDVARAWPLIRVFMDDTPFRKKLETSIRRYTPRPGPAKRVAVRPNPSLETPNGVALGPATAAGAHSAVAGPRATPSGSAQPRSG